jgi:hypothetical protein
MAKKQTFAEKVAKIKGAGMEHCPVCNEIMTPTKVRAMETIDGRTRSVAKMIKVCKCNASKIFD